MRDEKGRVKAAGWCPKCKVLANGNSVFTLVGDAKCEREREVFLKKDGRA